MRYLVKQSITMTEEVIVTAKNKREAEEKARDAFGSSKHDIGQHNTDGQTIIYSEKHKYFNDDVYEVKE